MNKVAIFCMAGILVFMGQSLSCRSLVSHRKFIILSSPCLGASCLELIFIYMNYSYYEVQASKIPFHSRMGYFVRVLVNKQSIPEFLSIHGRKPFSLEAKASPCVSLSFRTRVPLGGVHLEVKKKSP